MPRYAAKKDSNHAKIKEVFRKSLGNHVTDSSKWGDGAGDLFVSYRTYGCFIEIKDGENKKLTPAQVKFVRKHPEQWHRCNTEDDAVKLCAYIRAMGNGFRVPL